MRSKDKLRRDLIVGSDERKSVGDFVNKERDIDHDNDRYREKITDKKGVVLREVDEPLSEHRGRGSAKFKTAGDNSSSEDSEGNKTS